MDEPDTTTMLLEPTHLATALELNATLQKQVCLLETKVKQLETTRGVNVLAYGNSKDVRIAIVCTSGDKERWQKSVSAFKKRRNDFAKAGIAWSAVENIQLNETYDNPLQ